MIDSERGTGRTARQLIGAQPQAVFIYAEYREDWYLKNLCQKLNRTDIELRPISWLEGDQWKGRQFSEVIADHHALDVMNPRQFELYRIVQQRVR